MNEGLEGTREKRQDIITVTRREGTGGSLLAHVETSEELDPQMRVDHVVHLD